MDRRNVGEQEIAHEERLRQPKLRIKIAAIALDLHCTQLTDTIALEVEIAGKAPSLELPDGVSCFMRAITVANERGYDAAALFAKAQPRMTLGSVPLSEVTRWLGIRLRDERTGVEVAFTLGARLVGVPDGRDAAVLRAHIANVENFFRYLSLLLGSLGEGSFLESETAGEGQWLRRLGQGGASLLEPMVRALSLDSGELVEIDQLIKRLEDPEGGAPYFIDKAQVENFAEIPLRNGRMRALADTAFQYGLDRALWIPPSRPSFGEPVPATKTLVFSDWSMVPDAIAALLSHEASRRMNMSLDLVGRTSRPIGVEEMMPMLCPSPTLAAWVDPLQLEQRHGRAGTYAELLVQVRQVLGERLNPACLSRLAERSDRLLPLTIEAELDRGVDWGRVGAIEHDAHDEHGAMARTIEAIKQALDSDDHHGDPDPRDIVDKLAEFALGSPATCALRALARLCPELQIDDPALVGAAIVVALGFRSLYNQPLYR